MKRWTGESSKRQRYNTATLKDTWKQKEHNWHKENVAVISECKEVLGFKSYTHKEWTSAETLKKDEKRRQVSTIAEHDPQK